MPGLAQYQCIGDCRGLQLGTASHAYRRAHASLRARQRYAVGEDKRTRTMSRKMRPGGAEGNRTPDLLNAIQALSQLSYGPDRSGEGV
jgi:hypothetical protein